MSKKEKQNNDNIIEFKSKKEIENQKHKKAFNISGKKILAMILGILIFSILGIVILCPIKTLKVDGMRYYSKEDILSSVKANGYINNSVFLKLRNQILPIKTMPFVESIDIEIENRSTVTIKVHENLRAGCVSYAGKYVYFDKNGYALEVMDKRLKDVPLVTGLSYDNIVISEKLPIKKKKYFGKIIKITTLITKNELTIREIQFKENGHILLKRKKIVVDLGTGKELDSKLNVLPGVFKSLKGKSGTVYMDQYTKDNKIITFRKKK